MTTKTECLICHKPLKRAGQMVHMSIDLIVYGPDFSYKVSPAKDQGWFEVGSDCYRKVLKAGPKGVQL